MSVRFEIVSVTCETLGLGDGADFTRRFDMAEGETVSSLLKRLVTEETRLADNLYYPNTGVVTDKVRIILSGVFLDLNGVLLDTDRPNLATALKDGDRLVVVPGGSG